MPEFAQTSASTVESFITEIRINKIRHIENFDIPLSGTERKTLILTGKNGSGKTSLLNAIDGNLMRTISQTPIQQNHIKAEIVRLEKEMQKLKNQGQVQFVRGHHIPQLQQLNDQLLGFGLSVTYNLAPASLYTKGNFVVSYFRAKRATEFNEPEGVKKIETKPAYSANESIGREFVQYLVNLKANKAFAKEQGDEAEARRIDDWFASFETKLRSIFQSEGLELAFDYKNAYTFQIRENNREPYSFNQLSDGFSSILDIITELIMRMENKGQTTAIYDMQGVVLIDEIETHLHVSLQKQILPFLTTFFPKIQFIVTTHSPFILTSLENAVICDLEKQTVISSSIAYPVDSVTENYFNEGRHSAPLVEKVAEYKTLASRQNLADGEAARFEELKKYFEDTSNILTDELASEIQNIKLMLLKKKASGGKNK